MRLIRLPVELLPKGKTLLIEKNHKLEDRIVDILDDPYGLLHSDEGAYYIEKKYLDTNTWILKYNFLRLITISYVDNFFELIKKLPSDDQDQIVFRHPDRDKILITRVSQLNGWQPRVLVF